MKNFEDRVLCVLYIVALLASFALIFRPERSLSAEEDRARAQLEQQLADQAASRPPIPTVPATTAPPTPGTTEPTIPATTMPAPASTIPTTTPPTTEAPNTTIPPEPTTTLPPPPPTAVPQYTPPQDPCTAPPRSPEFAVNGAVGKIYAPTMGMPEPVPIARADSYDAGNAALAGGAAWFDSSNFTPKDALCPDGTRHSLYDFSLPGEGGVVAIGGHRNSHWKPFHNLQDLQLGDPIIITIDYGLAGKFDFTYRVSQPCTENVQDTCGLPDNQLLPALVAGKTEVETLYLFSCDGDLRIYVQAQLEGFAPAPPS